MLMNAVYLIALILSVFALLPEADGFSDEDCVD